MAAIEKYQVEPSPGDRGTRYRVRYRTPEGASRKKAGFKTKREAQDFANSLEVSKTTGTFVDSKTGRTTVGHWWEVYLGGLEVKPTTKAARISAWNARVKKWEHVPVGSIKPSDVRAWVQEIKNTGGKPTPDGKPTPLGTASVEAALLLLRCILDVAVGDQALSGNPAAKVEAPARQEEPRPVLTAAQVQLLASEMPRRMDPVDRPDKDTDATLILFLVATGVRWGEAAALRVRSFDMLRRQVEIWEAVAEVSKTARPDAEQTFVWSTPKNGKARTVRFGEYLAGPLSRLMVGKGPDDRVFQAPKGGVHAISRFRPRVFDPAVKRCQAIDPTFPKVSPHDLRHTAATLAIANGATVLDVQTMLGHSSAAITLDRYAVHLSSGATQVADRLDALLEAAAQDRAEGHAGDTNVRNLA